MDEENFEVFEREYTIQEVLEALQEDRLLEIFGCGTAASVCPVKGIFYKEKLFEIPIDEKLQAGRLGAKVYK